jgi:hypothetical protein
MFLCMHCKLQVFITYRSRSVFSKFVTVEFANLNTNFNPIIPLDSTVPVAVPIKSVEFARQYCPNCSSNQIRWICHVSNIPVQQTIMRKSVSLTLRLWCSCFSNHWTRMAGFMLWSPVIRHEYIKNVCQAKWRLLQRGMYLLPADNAQRWRKGGGEYEGVIVTSSAFEIPWETAGTIRIQGYTRVQLYTFMCVNSKKQKSKYRKEG